MSYFKMPHCPHTMHDLESCWYKGNISSRNTSQTWKQTHLIQFLQGLLLTFVATSLYPSSLDTIMDNDYA